jgi:hypothetical protein
MQIVYNITGATVTESTDVGGFTTSRTLKGNMAKSGTLTVSGTVGMGNGYYADAVVTVSVGGNSQSWVEKIPTGWPDINRKSYSVSVPIPPGAESGSISINMTGYYNAGTRGLVVSGGFSTNWQPEELKLVSFTPGNKAVNVDWQNPKITATFDHDIDPTSLSDTTFWAEYYPGGVANKITGGLSPLGKTVTFTPTLKDTGREITVHVTGGPGGIRGNNGETLSGERTWTFTTLPNLIVEVIPVQVVEGANFVQNKPGVVRVKAMWAEDMITDVLDLSTKVTLFIDGIQTDSLNYTFMAREKMPSGTATYKARVKDGNSANFYFTKSVGLIAKTGAHSLRAVVEPTGQTVTPRRTFENPAQSVVTNPEKLIFRTAYIPVNVGAWTAGQTQNISNVADKSNAFLFKRFPVAEAKKRVDSTVSSLAPEITTPNSLYIKRLLLSLAQNNWFGPYNVVVGVVPDGWLRGMTQPDPAVGISANFIELAGYGATTYSAIVEASVKDQIAPHEIVHVLLGSPAGTDSEGHTPNDIELLGFDIGQKTCVNSTILALPYIYDLMNAAAASFSPDNVWISPLVYGSLLNRLNPAAASLTNLDEAPSLGAAGPVLNIAGELILNGAAETAQVDAVYILSNGILSNNVPGAPVAIELQNAGGGVLQSFTFQPVYTTGSDGKQYAPFIATLPYHTSTTRVVIRRNSTILLTLSRSPNAPLVSITAPLSGQQLSGTANITWTATDADNNPMTYALLYSANNGLTWDLVARNLTAKTYGLDTTTLPTSTQAKIKVIANDDFNTTEAISATFKVVNPPAVTSTQPAADSTGISTYAALHVFFRDAMNPATLNTNTYILRSPDGQAVAGSVSYNDAGLGAVFNPETPLAYNTLYTAQLTTGVESLSGMALPASLSWSFTTTGFFIHLPLIIR